jgi:crotonobetainyl-CoA:carnitine CoA-transferase CaiB-like acyl-CoA transferase
VRSLGFPPHLRAGAISYRLAPPTLGQHTDEVLAELGFMANDITCLHEGEVV